MQLWQLHNRSLAKDLRTLNSFFRTLLGRFVPTGRLVAVKGRRGTASRAIALPEAGEEGLQHVHGAHVPGGRVPIAPRSGGPADVNKWF